MKKVLFSVAFLFITVLISAQNPLPKGKADLNAGFGFSNYGLPIYVGFDYGVHKDITIGGELCFRAYHDGYYHNRGVGISFNGNYHFNTIMHIPSNWDFYAGLNLGYTFWNYDHNYHGNDYYDFGLGAQIGGRYFFTNKFGINLELGGGAGSSGGKFGITYKF